MHPDPLGSPDVLTDENGQRLEPKSYEAFGAPRHADWRSVEPPLPSSTSLGFTGHEDDRELGLVNMRGRVYDPVLARFLTPDAVVQAPSFSASWNPYSYAFHSPLRYTDPSGFTVAPPPAPAPPVTPPSPPPPPAPTELQPMPPPSDFPVVGPWGNGVETTGPAPYGAQPQAAPAPPPSQPTWSVSGQGPVHLDDPFWKPVGDALGLTALDVLCQAIGCGTISPADQPGGAEVRSLTLPAHAVRAAAVAVSVSPFGAAGRLAGALARPGPGISVENGIRDSLSLEQSAAEDALTQGSQALDKVAGGSVREINPSGSVTNCANCAVVTDAMLAGYPASALPGRPMQVAELSRNLGRYNWFPANGVKGMNTVMQNWGPGSRAIVLGSRGTEEIGHYFNVVNQGGVVRFLDGQRGGPALLEGFEGFYMLRTH